jgi:hypothetical protein
MRPLRPAIVFALVGMLVIGCGATSTSTPEGNTKGGAGSSSQGGTPSTGGDPATGGRSDNSGGAEPGTGGTRGGSVGTGGEGVRGGSESGGTHSGGTTGTGGSGGTALKGGSGGGGATSTGGSSGGAASGGTSGQGAGGASAGERAVQCTGTMPYFPEFKRACVTKSDCIAVAHQTNCCGAQLVSGISASEKAAFDAAESICDQQYPACGCAAFGVDVEDGTRVDFAWQNKIEVVCDASTCKAHYSGTSFACGTRRCTEQQYCIQSSGGPAGTPTSYSCNPSACTDCSCLTMPGCTCTSTDGHLTFTCQYP